MAKSSVSLSYMEATIKAIRTRILARLALQQQLTSLGKNTYTSLRFLIHPFWIQSLFQSKSTCKIVVIVISSTFSMNNIASSLDIQLNFSSWDPTYLQGLFNNRPMFWSTLEGLTIPQNKNHLQMFPSKISSLLYSWSPATLEEFSVSMIHFCI